MDVPEGKKIYFLSDAHLGTPFHALRKQNEPIEGSRWTTVSHEVERKLCRFFDMAKADAHAIFLMGDMFDYWFEYKTVIPRGFTRFLGKMSELSDNGIDIHFFIGNHDIWLSDYLEKECGVTVHRSAWETEIGGQRFFLAHGDGLGDDSKSFQILRKLFHSKLCRRLFANIHPRWSIAFAHRWARHNRITGAMVGYLGEDKEHLVQFAKKQLKLTPDIRFFIFGHRHILLDLMISATSRIVILGDWLQYFSYGMFDGANFSLELFENDD